MKQEGGVLPAFMALNAASLITSIAFSLIKLVRLSLLKSVFGKGVSKTQERGIISLLAEALLLKAILRKWYTNMGHMDKSF